MGLPGLPQVYFRILYKHTCKNRNHRRVLRKGNLALAAAAWRAASVRKMMYVPAVIRATARTRIGAKTDAVLRKKGLAAALRASRPHSAQKAFCKRSSRALLRCLFASVAKMRCWMCSSKTKAAASFTTAAA